MELTTPFLRSKRFFPKSKSVNTKFEFRSSFKLKTPETTAFLDLKISFSEKTCPFPGFGE